MRLLPRQTSVPRRRSTPARCANRRTRLHARPERGAVCFALLVVVANRRRASRVAGDGDGPCGEKPGSLRPRISFGTDRLGRDMLVRTICGPVDEHAGSACIAAFVASSVIALVLAARRRHLAASKADAVVTWLVDLMMSIPHIVLLILISYALGKGFWGVTIGRRHHALAEPAPRHQARGGAAVSSRRRYRRDFAVRLGACARSKIALHGISRPPCSAAASSWGSCLLFPACDPCTRRRSRFWASGCRRRCPPSASS